MVTPSPRFSSTQLYSPKKISQLHLSGNKIYGILGRGLPSTVDTTRFDTSNLKGKYGENVIGSMLNILALENDALYAFHSVKAPYNKPGETDHIILYEKKLILVETKTYLNFREFNISKEGTLYGQKYDKNGTRRKLNNNNLIEKVQSYEILFPEYKIHAITAITRSNVRTTSENGKYKVASLSNIIQNIDYHIRSAHSATEDLNKESIHYLASQCLNK